MAASGDAIQCPFDRVHVEAAQPHCAELGVEGGQRPQLPGQRRRGDFSPGEVAVTPAGDHLADGGVAVDDNAFGGLAQQRRQLRLDLETGAGAHLATPAVVDDELADPAATRLVAVHGAGAVGAFPCHGGLTSSRVFPAVGGAIWGATGGYAR